MGATNYGNQILSFDYNEEARASNFNKIQYGLTPMGIYSGCELSISGSDELTMGEGVVYLDDNTRELGLRVEFTSAVPVALSFAQDKIYVVITFSWEDVVSNYADITAMSVNEIEILEADGSAYIIVGRGDYISSTLTGIDYGFRTTAPIKGVADNQNAFKVTTTEFFSTDISNKVYVNPGTAYINNKYVEFAGGESAVITDTADGRTDLVCIDDTGAIQIVYGDNDLSPVQPDFPLDYMVVGIINRSRSSASEVYGSEIYQVTPNREFDKVAVENRTLGYFGNLVIPIMYVSDTTLLNYNSSAYLSGYFGCYIGGIWYETTISTQTLTATSNSNNMYVYGQGSGTTLLISASETVPVYDSTNKYWVMDGDTSYRYLGVTLVKYASGFFIRFHASGDGANSVHAVYAAADIIENDEDTQSYNQGVQLMNETYVSPSSTYYKLMSEVEVTGITVQEVSLGINMYSNYSAGCLAYLYINDTVTTEKRHIIPWVDMTSGGDTRKMFPVFRADHAKAQVGVWVYYGLSGFDYISKIYLRESKNKF